MDIEEAIWEVLQQLKIAEDTEQACADELSEAEVETERLRARLAELQSMQ